MLKLFTKTQARFAFWKSERRSILKDFDDFVQDGIRKMQWSEGTVKRWKTFNEHLVRFMERLGMENGRSNELTYDDFNETMLSSFVDFLSDECGFRNSTVAKEAKMLKWFLRWADRKGYIKTREYDKFRPKLKSVPGAVIFLTTEELMRLYRLEIPSDTPQYEQMSLSRDIFCFCSFTSLRFSDASRLKMSNVQGKRLVLTTQKTNDSLAIDINPFAREILARYVPQTTHRETVFPHIAMSTVNIHIKTLSRMCGIDTPVLRTWFSGRDRFEETLPKWKCLSTHAARRTFICAALSSGVNVETVMKWTGHSSYKSMKPYIDVTDEEKAKAMEKVFNFLGE